MIEYLKTAGDTWNVYLSENGRKKLAGHIKGSKAGFQYFPKGKKEGGDIYDSLDECQQSLEGE
jgi:hypothetical protein